MVAWPCVSPCTPSTTTVLITALREVERQHRRGVPADAAGAICHAVASRDEAAGP